MNLLGELPGRTVTVESEVGTVEAVAHRPHTGPTAMWRIEWRMVEV